ncbi:MAG: hypothetical protein IKC82_00565 [Lentisphaeria bacterium]|nr:hypothetical protein [Lentisphaeria bacterium]
MKNHFRFYSTLLTAGVILCGCSDSNTAAEKLNHAVNQARNGNWQLAGKYAQDVALVSEKASAPLILSALAYEKDGEYNKALDLARQAVNASPDDFTALYTLGRLYSHDHQRHSEAFTTLEEALIRKPGDTNTLILLCNLGVIRQEPNTDKYLNLLKQKPEFATSLELHFLLGMRQAEKRNIEAAKRFMLAALNKCGGMKKPDIIYDIANCFDRCRFPASESRKFYNLYVRARGKKDPAKVIAAKKRLRQL